MHQNLHFTLLLIDFFHISTTLYHCAYKSGANGRIRRSWMEEAETKKGKNCFSDLLQKKSEKLFVDKRYNRNGRQSNIPTGRCGQKRKHLKNRQSKCKFNF